MDSKMKKGLKNLRQNLSVFLPILFVLEIILGTFAPVRLPFEQSKPEAKAVADWYNGSWLYRKTITVTSSESIVSSTHDNFPMLVSTTDSNLTSYASSTGADIIFTSSDGTAKLSHEIDSYTSSTGALLAWVKIPTLTTSTVIYMYYGNTGVTTTQESVTSTWNSNYIAVWHMKEASGTTAADAVGAHNGTLNSNDNSTSETNVASVAGKIGNARSTTSTGYIAVGITSTLGLTYTIDTWAYFPAGGAANSSWRILLEGANADEYPLLVNDTEHYIGQYRGGFHGTFIGQAYTNYDTDDLSTGWHHVVASAASSGNETGPNTYYIDGVSIGYTAAALNVSVQTIGNNRQANPNNQAWGPIDEMRISNTAHSAAWIKTEYNNHNNPSTFYTISSQESNDTGYYFAVTGSATQTAGNAQTVTVTMKDSNNSNATATAYTGSHSLIFSGPNTPDSGDNPTASGANLGSTTTLTFASGVATTSLILYKAETVSLDVLDATTTSYTSTSSAAYDLDIVVSHGAFTLLGIDDTLTTATSGVAFSLMHGTFDAYENAATSTIVTTTVTVSTGTISPSSIPASAYYGDGNVTTNTIISGITEVQSVIATFTNGSVTNTITFVVTGTPAIPTGFSATRSSDTSFTLAWTITSNLETGIVVERAVDSGSGFGAYTAITTTPANATNTIDTGTEANRKYQWRVASVSTVGTSTYASDSIVHYTTPSAPTAVTSTRVSDSAFTVTFTTSTAITASSTVERCSGSGCDSNTFTPITGSPTTSASISDAGTAANNRYKWRVAAFSGSPENVTSTYVTSSYEYTSPTAPAVVTSTFVSNSQIDLTWTDSSAYEDGFRVEVSADGGSYSEVTTSTNTVSAGVTSYSFMSSTANHIYQFKVRAHVPTSTANTTDLYSSYTTSNVVTTTPSAPSGVSVTRNSDTSFTVAWTDNSGSVETGFLVEQSTDSGSGFGSYTPFTTTSINATSFNDTTTLPNNRYQYRVKAVGTAGNSATASDSIVHYTTPSAPTSVTSTRVSDSAFTIIFTTSSAITNTSTIERCADTACDTNTFTALTGSPTTTASFADTTTAANNRYKWRIGAFSGLPENVTSTYITSTYEYTTPAAPSAFTATYSSDSLINLSLTTSSLYHDGLRIEVSTDGGTYSEVSTSTNTIGSTTTTYAFVSSTANHIYQFRVRAHVPTSTANSSDLFSSYTTSSVVTTTPSAPTIGSSSTNTSTALTVTWTDNSSYETGFAVTFVVGTTTATTTAANATSLTLTGLLPNIRYQAIVSAVGGSSTSTPSTTSTALYTLAAVPSAALGTPTQTTIPLTITPNNNSSSTEYKIYNATDNVFLAASGAANGSTAIWQTTSTWGSGFAATGLTCATSYTFTVVGRNGDSVLAASSTASATTAACSSGSSGGGGFSPPLSAPAPEPVALPPAIINPPTPTPPTSTVKTVTTTPSVPTPTTTLATTSTPAIPTTPSSTATTLEEKNTTAPLIPLTPPTPPKPTPPAFPRALKNGFKGDDVKKLQIYLNTHQFIITKSGLGSPGKETTFFGRATFLALQKFQKANKLKQTGNLDTTTRTLLNKLTAPTQDKGVKVTEQTGKPQLAQPLQFPSHLIGLKAGDKGPKVKELQIFLNANGYTIAKSGPGSPGKETNLFGRATDLAVREWQRRSGKRVNGIVVR